jgi:hypothetical protein
MRVIAQLLVIASLWTTGVSGAAPPAPLASSSQAAAFVGTWTVNMTSPEAMKGPPFIVRISNTDGRLAMSVQTAPNAPAQEATGVLLDGNMLIASIGRHAPSPMRENGAPIWSVFTLTLDGDGIKLALTLENSMTIKRGVGRKQ